MTDNVEQELSELAKRRGFFTQSSEAYGGVAGFYTYGPQGAALKENIEDAWRDRFTVKEGNREIEAPIVMPEPVFEASGHLDGFDDMIIECPECGVSHRADHLVEDNTEIEEAESFPTDRVEEIIEEHDLGCPSCGTSLAGVEVEEFNLMFGTSIGPGNGSPGYLRPETAQGIFVEFPRLKEYARNQLPFGITQIGKSYRNEISPRKQIIRTREFTQAELELFIDPEEDRPDLEDVKEIEVKLYPAEEQESEDGELLELTIEEAVDRGILENEWIAYYLGLAKNWFRRIGVDMEKFRFRQHLSGERAHYAEDCWDAEAFATDDWIELAGFAYRSDYDLRKHHEHSDDDFTIFKPYDEPKTVEETVVNPDMGYLGPEYGDTAGKIVEKLEQKAEEEPEAFESGDVAVDIDGESYVIPVDKTGFSREEVEKNGEHIIPHVVEPSFGVDRPVYAVLEHNLETDEVDGEERKVLRLEPEVAPTEVGVFPLMDKEGLGEKARELASRLREHGFSVEYDDSGAIGRRYRRQDEVGTPASVTIDYETLEDGGVTLRDRDTTEQVRVPLEQLEEKLEAFLEGEELEQL
ncbi:MAG: glycine--tRNA ligase [Candidatus Nanohaloarchaea archaeon]